ncbi:CDP-diacylglycerol-inositol 3-phosphatidyltransferase PIS [Aspergillus nomiae NRRL 13137]|uniref:CDP-diacylglycerol-inositol 3-phosphatidyltransferase PIS n=1 Tax=Aspergillus nomiae NRRL (strain ATCC 15546 / NRRL 13137 / CBS 260.88 / M93) TaxID=1509407 RepID=A0A0L1J041_ASPN3|nr:CDP-diacylglycerol-inositol 3-phosphatidyltransferase PIS [Aspergillus nomiae NRRL 13137]KNG84783.1 CDP-diacylglycerol-inositol 3-phosphatidyltransferase PIS [Aspergillus nomiae NRRL 13137]
MAARTRRQQAALAAQSDSNESPAGNGTVEKSPKKTRTSGKKEVKENVYLFAPNLIGKELLPVSRICSPLLQPVHHLRRGSGYGDGPLHNCVFTGVSESAWPRWSIVFQSLIALDMASHYMHMYATLSMGGSGQSHKKIDSSRSWILYQYYNSRTVLFICCALNELFFIGLYLLSFSSPILSPSLLQPVSGSGSDAAHPVSTHSFASPWSAGALEMARANKIDSTWPWIITGISAPVMALKQIINVVQLVKASNWLVEGDIANRKAQRAKKN